MVTEKQKIFVLAYLQTCNIASSLKEAGLNITVREGELLLRSPEVQKFIREEAEALVEHRRLLLLKHEEQVIGSLFRTATGKPSVYQVQAAKVLMERLDAVQKIREAMLKAGETANAPGGQSDQPELSEKQLRNLTLTPFRPSERKTKTKSG